MSVSQSDAASVSQWIESPHAQRHATSAAALDQLGARKRVFRGKRLLQILRDAHGAGVRDMTCAELAQAYEARHGGRMETGHCSARLDELLKRAQVERLADERVCTVTGYKARPVRVVPQQGRLVG